MAMERKAGRGFKPVGQRSISSMFSSPHHSTVGRPNNGHPLSLMEFLNRKSEKRTSIQGCVADAGLTLEVRERLQSTGPDCTGPFRRGTVSFRDHGDGIDEVESVEEECSTSSYQDEIAMSKAQADAQARDRSRNRVRRAPPRLEIFSKQGGSIPAVDAGSCYSTNNIHNKLDGHHVAETPQSSGVDFIDLTEDEVNPGGGNCLAGEDVSTETVDHRKRKRRWLAEPGATEICPVCDELFPPHMLQAHVESELAALEMSETDAVPEAHDVVPAGGHELPRPDDAEWSAELKEPGSRSSRSSHTSVLVLGDEPKHRRQRNGGTHNKRPLKSSAATFNHYADGGGWWDEGGVGVDAEAVGSVTVWEGLGSMSFGGML